MSTQPQEGGPVTREFRSAQSISWLLGGLSVVLWVTIAFVVRSGNGIAGDGTVSVFVPGPGTVVLFALALTATVFSAAAFAVSWVAVIAHKANVSLWRVMQENAKAGGTGE